MNVTGVKKCELPITRESHKMQYKQIEKQRKKVIFVKLKTYSEFLEMAKEIERKFLVTADAYKTLGKPYRIKQGYICSEQDRVVRVRIKEEQAFITIKNATIGFARNEFEYFIPVADAEQMLLCV